MTNIGFYPGSFDPITIGHLDIIRRAAVIFDRLVVAVGVHHTKSPLLSAQERMELMQTEVSAISSQTGKPVDVVSFDDLTVDAAKRAKANVIVRGLRDTSDFNYETQMAGTNRTVAPDIDTVFLVSSPEMRHIAAKFVRQIASMNGDISAFVPQSVVAKLQARFDAKD